MNLSKLLPQSSPLFSPFQKLFRNIFKRNVHTRKTFSFTKTIFASLFFALPFASVAQEPGSLDLSFGTNGTVTTYIDHGDFGYSYDARSVAIQSDGKIVVAGSASVSHRYLMYDYYDIELFRYNTDGSLDSSFAGDGILDNNYVGYDCQFNSVAIQSDGKIVATGYSTYGTDDTGYPNDFTTLVVRFNTDGSLDPSFGGVGIVTTRLGGNSDVGRSVAIQNDGKIVVAGTSGYGSSKNFAVIRYNNDGSLDTSFDTDGILITDIGSVSNSASSLALQIDGKIVVAGTSSNGSNNDFTILRYNIDGSLDASFDMDGMMTLPINGIVNSIAIQSDGKIVAAGAAYNGSNNDFAAVRCNTDGSLDASFDGDGMVTFQIGSFDDELKSVAIQSDGKIVVTGIYKYSTYVYKYAIARFHTDGSLDASFDRDGIVTPSIGLSVSMAIQSNGKIVVAGRNNGSFFVARHNDACRTIPFSQSYTICAGSTMNVGTNTYTTSGVYDDTLTSVNTICDSIVNTILTVIPISSSSQLFTICAGESISVGSNTYTSSGTYNDTAIVANTCNVIFTNLTVNPVSASYQSFAICSGESISVGSNTYTASGTYTDTLRGVYTCDSIVTTNLIVNPISTSSQSLTICAGESISVDTHTYSASGTYTDTLTGVFTCDSIVTTILKVNPISASSQSFTICDGERINVGTNTYTTSGTFTDHFIAANACDSIVTTNLKVDPMPLLTTSQNAFIISSNQYGASYQWIDCNNNNTPISGEIWRSFTTTANGSYAVIVTLNGCSDTSNCVDNSTIGISELTNMRAAITIYPNPFSTTTTLHTDLLLYHASLTVYNVLGEQVEQTTNINGQSITFSRNNLLSGLYFCKLTQDNVTIASGRLTIID